MLHRDETGSGRPLVMVHGAWADGRHWSRLADELAGGFRVVRYDRRGHGRSGGRHVTIDDDVKDLLELIASLGEPAHVVGGSLGGTIALRAATASPPAFLTLAVHEPALPGLFGDAPPAPQRVPTPREFAEESLGEGWWERLSGDEQAAFEAGGDAWRDEMADRDAFTIEVDALRAAFDRPLLVTIGGASPPFWRKIADALPATDRATIDGAGHLPHLSHAREYSRALDEFLSAAAARR
jgi:pimeloyl-ACP methyl ester carboxylesterase